MPRNLFQVWALSKNPLEYESGAFVYENLQAKNFKKDNLFYIQMPNQELVRLVNKHFIPGVDCAGFNTPLPQFVIVRKKGLFNNNESIFVTKKAKELPCC